MMKRFAVVVCALSLGAIAPAQMVSGRDMPGFNRELGLLPPAVGIEIRQIGATSGTNVLLPGEQTTLTFLVTNSTDKAMALDGQMKVVGYRTSVPRGDIWTPYVHRVGTPVSSPIRLRLPARQSVRLKVSPKVPARFGGYAVVFDLGSTGKLFGATLARVVAPSAGRVFEPAYAIDMPWPHEMSALVPQTFYKLGVKGCRMAASYVPTTDPDFERSMGALGEHLDWCRKNNITVMLTLGAGSAKMPLDRGRPWLRDDNTMMEGSKEDLAWLPSQDPDFRKWVRVLCERYGWPKGPVNAVELWNEPWEGVSISGWGADLPRYREIYEQMGLGVVDARKSAGVKVLIGGTSSTSNTRDKLFADGKQTFLDYLDFVSVHYEGTGVSSPLEPTWMQRKGPYGRVRVWDTESWVANSEDRIAGVVASMLSFGQDRAMGTYGGNVYSASVHRIENTYYPTVHAWSPAAAVAAAAKYIGERRFEKLLFKEGLPWVFVLAEKAKPDDGTLVVLGDMTSLYSPRGVLYPSAQLGLPKEGGALTIKADRSFRMLDFAGNILPPANGFYRIPLNSNGYFLRTDGSHGSFARMKDAVTKGRIVGYPPVVLQAEDMLDDRNPVVTVSVHNILNRPVRGKLSGRISDSTFVNAPVTIAANATAVIKVRVKDLRLRPDNNYPALFTFDAGADGRTRHTEVLRINAISRRSIVVDGNLEEWKGVLPQNVTGQGIRASITEEAWLPFVTRNNQTGKSLTSAYLAYDDEGFYFAAKILDPTPYAGNIRFGTRDDASYYYPEVSLSMSESGRVFGVRWTGTIRPPVSGKYRILTQSDDGVRLWIDGKLVIDNWSDHGTATDEVTVALEGAKPVSVRMEYYQGSGGAEVRLLWEGPRIDRRTIPGDFERVVFANRDLKEEIGRRKDTKIDFTLGPDLPGVASPGQFQQHRWPEGIRRFSYRKDPDLPAGIGTDNVQIAFNVLPPDRKYLRQHPKGVMPRYVAYPDTDYEFSLNSVAPAFGGGTEIFRLHAPGIPRKHFYPRQPKSPIDGGPVANGKLSIKRVGDSRIVEAMIPWSEIPEVKREMERSGTIKFSFRVNDNNGPAYELAQGRSVSKENPLSFHNDWTTHWANEVRFAFRR